MIISHISVQVRVLPESENRDRVDSGNRFFGSVSGYPITRAASSKYTYLGYVHFIHKYIYLAHFKNPLCTTDCTDCTSCLYVHVLPFNQFGRVQSAMVRKG